MKVQDSPVFRRFWYVAMPVVDLDSGPKPFKLFDVDLVLWKSESGEVAAIADRCCHRTARLSLGEVIGDRIACPYHGWEFSTQGRCEKIPQMPEFTPPSGTCVDSYYAQVRYGMVWVALEEPLADIPDMAEERDENYRLIPEFHEVWNMSLFRLVDNWFDLAHVAFVHRATQGDINRPVPPAEVLEETEFGMISRNKYTIANREEGMNYTGIADLETTRDRVATWFAPNCRRLSIGYPNGLHHIIFTTATPLAEGQILFTQWCIRNDTEEQIPAEAAIAFDRKVTAEDKDILESTLPDLPILPHEPAEKGMLPDRAQMAARRKLRDIVTKYADDKNLAA